MQNGFKKLLRKICPTEGILNLRRKTEYILTNHFIRFRTKVPYPINWTGNLTKMPFNMI